MKDVIVFSFKGDENLSLKFKISLKFPVIKL